MIQRVELNAYYHVPIHCPFCGQRVVDEGAIDPCPHTLFFCHDMGFEYRSSRFDEALGIVGIDGEDLGEEEGGYDALTDRVDLPDAIKFAAYQGPPSGYGTYVGFAPLDGDDA